MIKTLSNILILIFCSIPLLSQNIKMLKLKTIDIEKTNPLINIEIYLCSNDSILWFTIPDQNGVFSLFLDYPLKELDSVYLKIQDFDRKHIDTVFIKDINLLEKNYKSFFELVLLEYNIFSEKEFNEYSRKHGLIPKRQKGLEKDVH